MPPGRVPMEQQLLAMMLLNVPLLSMPHVSLPGALLTLGWLVLCANARTLAHVSSLHPLCHCSGLQ
jgi:hypothetical protein